jgi:hypothetical protein
MTPVPSAVALLPLIALLGGSSTPGARAQTFEIDIADISNAPDACPSQTQLAEALEARMPGIVARAGHEAGTNLLHLSLTVTPQGVARVVMTDATGASRLERELDLPRSAPGGAGHGAQARDRGADCAALADTVALIVERYMRHIGYREPPPTALVRREPPPPPPPPSPPPPKQGTQGLLGVGLSARPAWRSPARFEPELTGELLLGRLSLSATTAATRPIERAIPMNPGAGTFTLIALPSRLALGWSLVLGERARLTPTLAAGLDVVWARTKGIGVTRQSVAVEPTVEGGLAATISLTHRIWIGAHAFQGVDLRPEEFYVTTGPAAQPLTLFMTPRLYARVGVDFGVFLGKN